jgi:hypothetical protein
MEPWEYEQEAAMEAFIEEELRRIAEEPVFYYLAVFGDAIEARVQLCLAQAQDLRGSGYYGAALTRAASGIEVAIRFFLARPLVQGAFLSDDWAELLSRKVLSGRTAEDRELLPAILRNWKIDITEVKLPDGSQVWEQIVKSVWPRRNDYVHKADDSSEGDASLAIECLRALLAKVVDPLATKLGFTREKTGCWSIIAKENPPEYPELNPPKTYTRSDPFLPKT